MINFVSCTVLPPGASKLYQTHKFDNFLDLIQFFQIWPDSVLIGMNDVKNNVMNNFELDDQLSRIHSFHFKSLWSRQNSVIFRKIAEKIVFWSNLEAPREKTVYLPKFIMKFKIVVNNIVDIIHFDQNTFRSSLKELCKI